jgi:hypothetical protein
MQSAQSRLPSAKAFVAFVALETLLHTVHVTACKYTSYLLMCNYRTGKLWRCARAGRLTKAVGVPSVRPERRSVPIVGGLRAV